MVRNITWGIDLKKKTHLQPVNIKKKTAQRSDIYIYKVYLIVHNRKSKELDTCPVIGFG